MIKSISYKIAENSMKNMMYIPSMPLIFVHLVELVSRLRVYNIWKNINTRW